MTAKLTRIRGHPATSASCHCPAMTDKHKKKPRKQLISISINHLAQLKSINPGLTPCNTEACTFQQSLPYSPMTSHPSHDFSKVCEDAMHRAASGRSVRADNLVVQNLVSGFLNGATEKQSSRDREFGSW